MQHAKAKPDSLGRKAKVRPIRATPRASPC